MAGTNIPDGHSGPESKEGTTIAQRFWFRTVVPSYYQIPTNGPVGRLLPGPTSTATRCAVRQSLIRDFDIPPRCGRRPA
jgi:hypothetical protein